jgi:amino acid transporter
MAKLKEIFIGKPLENMDLSKEKYGVFWGLPILSSDAISSIAYASEEILMILVPILGLLAYGYLTWISLGIVGLLAILILSYRQVISSYPNGGGSYIAANENLGSIPGVMAGSALAIDYILTVAVSVCASTDAIASALNFLYPYRIWVSLLILAFLFIGNLRGLKESSRLFGIPAYAFMLSIIAMIVVGLNKAAHGHIPAQPVVSNSSGMEPLMFFLLLRAFASGCTALTGVEAVSNSVSNFKEPAAKRAKWVLFLLGFVVLILFGGTSLLANLYHVVPVYSGHTVLSLINEAVFERSYIYYIIQAITAMILAMAANTAYAGFPMHLSFMARDYYVPRRMTFRGDRLNYSNGIIVLSVLAGILIIAYQSNTHALIPLYAVGAFISYTLSQTGMLVKGLRSNEKFRLLKMAVNGVGMFVTGSAALIIGISKFTHGAWIVFLTIPFLMMMMLRIKRHYRMVAEKLRLNPEEVAAVNLTRQNYDIHVIVPIDSINRASIRALRYARTLSNKVVAFCVAINDERAQRIKEQWRQLNTDIPLIVKYSPYRKELQPLFDYINSYEENQYQKGDIITIVLSQFTIHSWVDYFLHSQTRWRISKELMKHEHVVIATIPLQLKLVQHGVENLIGDTHNINNSN